MAHMLQSPPQVEHRVLILYGLFFFLIVSYLYVIHGVVLEYLCSQEQEEVLLGEV